MGVPTITLAGSHYVSRMSTAVLAGANMQEWIANDQDQYINLAREHSPAFRSCAPIVSDGVVSFRRAVG